MDSKIFGAIHFLAGKWSATDWLIVFFAKFLPLLLVIAAIIFIFSRKNQKTGVAIFCVTAASLILSRGLFTEIIRFFYHRSRPFEALGFEPLISESNNSFPSGHAAFFFALAAAMFYFNRKLGLWFFLFAFLNGLARIMAGVHWPTDILGGAAVGILSLFLIKAFFGKKFASPENLSQEYAG